MIASELQRNMADPFWRMANLYAIKQEGTGRAIPFRMRPEQRIVLQHLYDNPLEPAYIVKSRRLGLSTGIGVGVVDYSLWNGGAVCRLIERSMEHAGEKMRDIMRFAYNSMPDELRACFDVKHKDSPHILDPLARGLPEERRSQVIAGVGARGGDSSWLHVSEWGPIAATDPHRSREILTGAFPSASRGRRVVETTWMGGKSGDLWSLIEPLMRKDPDAEGKLFFFPWHGDPELIRLDGQDLQRGDQEYFRDLEAKLEKTFRHEQKRWYVVKKKSLGIFMRREYPSTLAEAFSAPVAGSIYGESVDLARSESRVGNLWPVDPSCLVHTAWDLGSPANTVVWYFQLIGAMLRFVDVDADLDLTTLQRVAHMKGKSFGNQIGQHFMPHDANSRNATGESPIGSFTKAGLQNIRIIPRTHDIWTGINAVRELFPLMQFRTPECEEAVAILGTYHTRPAGTGGTIVDEPVHDRASHYADAMRQAAEAIRLGMLKFMWGPGIDPSNVRMPQRGSDWKRRGKVQMRVGG